MKRLSRCSKVRGLTAKCIVLAAVVWPALCPGQESFSLLDRDDTARQAAAVAASVVPPEKASSDISRLAGEYSFGNSFDKNYTLEISEDGKFLYRESSYENVTDQVTGNVKLEDGRVVLKPDKPRTDWPRGVSDTLLPISWGQRLYLVPEDDIAGFSNEINRGTEPVRRGSVGQYFLREGDWDRSVTGKPDLPKLWQERLLETPATGKIAGRDRSGRWIIDIGKDYGLYDGMELSAWSPDRRRFATLVVTETGSDTSAVEVVGSPSGVAVYGWTVHTRITPPPVQTVAAMEPERRQVPESQQPLTYKQPVQQTPQQQQMQFYQSLPMQQPVQQDAYCLPIAPMLQQVRPCEGVGWPVVPGPQPQVQGMAPATPEITK